MFPSALHDSKITWLSLSPSFWKRSVFLRPNVLRPHEIHEKEKPSSPNSSRMENVQINNEKI